MAELVLEHRFPNSQTNVLSDIVALFSSVTLMGNIRHLRGGGGGEVGAGGV